MRLMLLAFASFWILGCTNTTKVPKEILSKRKMEVVLWDIIQAERFSALFLQKDTASQNAQLKKFQLYDRVFTIHKVSKDDFVNSYKYYLSRPDMAKAIFDSISAKAERQKVESYKSVVPK